MKRIQFLTGTLLACGIALTMTTAWAAENNSQQGTAKVVNIHGSARFMTAENAAWRPLKVGAILTPGSVVQTAGDGSYVDLILNNPDATESAMGPTTSSSSSSSPPPMNASHNVHPKVTQDAVRILEDTALGIDKLTITQTGTDRLTETQLDLKAGRIFGTVKKLPAGSKYEIKLKNGVAGIRGTIYLVSADGDVNILSSLEDLAGSVPSGSLVLAYFGPDNNIITQVVADGQHFDARTQQLGPISDSVYQEMLSWAGQLGVMRGGIFVALAVDQTVYVVSPTTPKKIASAP